MKYYSTNSSSPHVGLKEAVIQGYAPDMGLYIPKHLPTIPSAFIRNMSGMSLQEISYAIANTLFGSDVPAEVLHDIVCATVNFEIPLTHINDNIFALELFHGPTMNFKDVGTRFMARLLSHLQSNGSDSSQINIITATSGGSGGAIANGFYNVPGVHVYVLYPHNKLTSVLESQFTTLGQNITPIEVNGSYNDCQDLVKAAFADKQLSIAKRITSANSINIARLLPQTFYYFYAYAQLSSRIPNPGNISIATPCGNLGNLVSAIISKKMGLPVNKLIAATSPNCDLTEFINTGDFKSTETFPTIMPAMDVSSPNNIPRIVPLFENSIEAMQQTLKPQIVNEKEVSNTIKHVYNNYAYLLDPHSASAYAAISRTIQPNEIGIITATAHPAKSKRTIDTILGTDISCPQSLMTNMRKKRKVVKLPAIYSHLRNFLLSDHS